MDGQAYRGIEISSRYESDKEIAVIKSAVDLLSVPIRGAILSIWCDSKASAVYSVNVESDWQIDDLLIEVDMAFRATGGHNGIVVFQGKNDHFICPWWADQDLELNA